MQLEEALFKHLTDTAAIQSLVANRVYPKVSPQGATFPLIVMHRIATDRDHSQAGSSQRATVLMQFDCKAATPLAARNLAEKVRLSLDGFAGSMGGGGGLSVQSSFVDNERDGYDEDLEVEVSSLDVEIAHFEQGPP